MLFDFDKFSRIAASVSPGGAYSLEETLNVFRYFFEKYEEVRGEPHPPIRASQIVRIMLDTSIDANRVTQFNDVVRIAQNERIVSRMGVN